MSSIIKFTWLLAFASLALSSSATAQLGFLCGFAESLTDGAHTGLMTDTGGANFASGVNPGCGGSIDPEDYWYSWSPDVDGTWSFSTCNMASYDTRLALYSSCAAGAPLACNDDSVGCASFSSFMPVSGLLDASTYFIQVGGFNDASGNATLDIIAPLGGDTCSTALGVTAGEQTLMTNTTAATASGVIPSCGGGNPPLDHWYSWAPSASGDWLFSMCNQANYDTRLALYSACNGAELGCNDDSAGCLATSNLFVNDLVANTTYFVQVGGWSGANGTSTLDISGPPPVNDTCGTAGVLPSGFSSTPFDTSLATNEGVVMSCNDIQVGSQDVWYEFTASEDGNHTFEVCGATYDIALAVYTSCGGAELDCQESGRCGGPPLNSVTSSVLLASGDTCFIQLGAFGGGSGGTGTLDVFLPPPGLNYCGTSPNDVDPVGAIMSATGSSSVSANDLVLSASPVPNAPGLFFYSDTAAISPIGFPLFEGRVCVLGSGTGVIRILPPALGVGNVMTKVVDNTQPFQGAGILVGSWAFFQCWYRDTQDNDGDGVAEGANYSDGLAIFFTP